MDFEYYQLSNSRPFVILTVVDLLSRKSPLIEPRQSFGGGDVAAAHGRAVMGSGVPVPITVDHGKEFTSRTL